MTSQLVGTASIVDVGMFERAAVDSHAFLASEPLSDRGRRLQCTQSGSGGSGWCRRRGGRSCGKGIAAGRRCRLSTAPLSPERRVGQEVLAWFPELRLSSAVSKCLHPLDKIAKVFRDVCCGVSVD